MAITNGVSGDQGTENGLRALIVLQRFLEDDEWHPSQVEEQPLFTMIFNGHNGQQHCFAHLRADLEQLLIYAVPGLRVPEERRRAVAEFITRANYGLRIGNFELDFADGEIRFKNSLDFEGEPLTDNLIRNVLYPAVQTMDFYLPGLIQVALEGSDPAEAIAALERG